MMNANDLVTLLDKHNNACHSRFQKEQQRIAESMAIGNDDVPPTIDDLGRLHAPVDGYFVDDIFYTKGQFIPMPHIESDDCFFTMPSLKSYSTRFQLSGEALKEVQALDQKALTGVSLSFGATFDRRGVNHAYVYIKSATLGFFNLTTEWLKKFELEKKNARTEKPKGNAPTGAKQAVTAKVIGLPSYESAYGYNQYEFKLMAELDNGATIFGTLPKALYDAEIGDTVSFTANFELAEDDTTHAFFKRPSKATLIKAAA